MSMNKRPEAIVVGCNYANALGMVKSVGEGGYLCGMLHHTAVVKKKMMTPDMVSRHVVQCKYIDKKNDEAMLETLLNEYRVEGEKPVLLAADDYSASFLDRYYDEVIPYFRTLQWKSGKGMLTYYMEKGHQKEAAEAVGFPCAQNWSVVIPKEGEEPCLPEGIIYPCITKPEVSASGGMSKELIEVIECEDDLVAYFKRIAEQKLEGTILVEEYLTIEEEYTIPGICLEDEVIIPSYVLKIETGSGKVRGLTVMGEVGDPEAYPQLKEDITALIHEMGLWGIFDVEIIKCKGKYYFNEINLRSSAATYAITGAGVNIAKIYIDYLMGKDWRANNQKVRVGMKFINEKPALQCLVQKDYTMEEYRALIEEADIRLLTGGDDMPSQEAFMAIEKRELHKASRRGQLEKQARRIRKRTIKRAKKVVKKGNRVMGRVEHAAAWRLRAVKRIGKNTLKSTTRDLFCKVFEVTDYAVLSELDQLLKETYLSAMQRDSFEFTNSTMFEDSLKEVLENDGKIFAATFNKKIVGCVALRPVQNEAWYAGETMMAFKHMVVMQKYQRLGIGSLLLENALDAAADAGMKVYLSTPEKNTSAISFYEKNGFEKMIFYYTHGHYAVHLVNWNGQERKSEEVCAIAYEDSAIRCIMKHYAEGIEIRDKKIRELWEEDFDPYFLGQDEAQTEDYYKCYRRYGITPKEYELFGLENQDGQSRRRYLSQRRIKLLNAKLSTGRLYEERILGNRFQEYELLKDLYQREMAMLESPEELEAFAGMHKQIAVRPVKRTSKRKHTLIDVDQNQTDFKKLYKKISSKKTKNGYLMEEVVLPGPIDTLKTNQFAYVNVLTALKDQEFDILSATLILAEKKETKAKFKKLAYAGVNRHSGNMTSGWNMVDPLRKAPELPFNEVPDWTKMEALVKEAASRLQDQMMIGWNLAYTEMGWILLDIQMNPSMTEAQILKGKGLRRRVDSLLGRNYTPYYEELLQ